jgi:peptide-methionine (R)-S-oxide reductase
MFRRFLIGMLAVAGFASGCSRTGPPTTSYQESGSDTARETRRARPVTVEENQTVADSVEKVVKSDEEWRKTLTAVQYHILREKGTERAFSGNYWKTKTPGVYVCAACGQELFDSDHKFDSGTGWPSYWQPIDEKNIDTETDRSLGMVRTEVLCSRCGGHLGHVFNDGPEPTGLRYCINSASLRLMERNQE